MRQRYIGNAGIEHLHERGQRHRDSNDPVIDRRPPFGGVIHGDGRSAHSYLNLCYELRAAREHESAARSSRLVARSYLIHTFGTTDIPGRSSCPLVSLLSNTIFTGMRCTTLT